METYGLTRWRWARSAVAPRPRTWLSDGSGIVQRLPHIGFQGCQRLCGRIRGPHRVRPDSGRNNECFSVMDFESRESTRWTLDDGAIAFHKVEHMDGAICMVRNRHSD